MKPVLISAQASREIDAAASFYESRKEGLGAKFAERVAEAIDRIKIAPEGYQAVYRDLRRVNLRQFKDWALWFKTLPDISLVVACLSSRQNPALARKRAFGVTPIKPPEPR